MFWRFAQCCSWPRHFKDQNIINRSHYHTEKNMCDLSEIMDSRLLSQIQYYVHFLVQYTKATYFDNWWKTMGIFAKVAKKDILKSLCIRRIHDYIWKITTLDEQLELSGSPNIQRRTIRMCSSTWAADDIIRVILSDMMTKLINGYVCSQAEEHSAWHLTVWNLLLQVDGVTAALTRAMWLLFHVLLSTSVVLLAMPAIW